MDQVAAIVHEISTKHHKIIDDWCKAYLAELYQTQGCIHPGNFILHEQQMKDGSRRYWFTPKEGCPICEARMHPNANK
jgi:hypothetical protein